MSQEDFHETPEEGERRPSLFDRIVLILEQARATVVRAVKHIYFIAETKGSMSSATVQT
jgi:hypothetical protein